jgi:Na+-transporting methylmalonyl-CoA/oxaloacetate decarboxylase gamma subunit
MIILKFILDYLLIFVLGGAVVFVFLYLLIDLIRSLIRYYNK